MEESGEHEFWGTTSEEILTNKFPLHRACRDGDVEALSILLIEAQHGIYVEDSFYGWTPAHWAAYFGKLACLRKLMTNTRIGVDCNLRTTRFIQTPTHLAAFGAHPHCLQWLLQSGADTAAQDYLGETAVHKAARTGSMECLSLLRADGARLYIKNNNNQTPGQLADTCGHSECSVYLENEAGRQMDSMPMGVYQDLPATNTTTQPSPHDITAKVHPCVINYGINGGKLPARPFPARPMDAPMAQPNIFSAQLNCPMPSQGDNDELSEMIAMEQESQEPCINGTRNGFHLNQSVVNGFGRGDVTLLTGISSNHIAVAGKKRCREECDEVEHKRMRKNDSFQPSSDCVWQDYNPRLTAHRQSPKKGGNNIQNNDQENMDPGQLLTTRAAYLEQGHDSMFYACNLEDYEHAIYGS